MAVAPVVIGKIADRYGRVQAVHLPIAAQLAGAAGFVLVIHFILKNGVRHPVLARHWDAEFPDSLAPVEALALERS